MKSEDEEEKPQSSRLNQTQTEENREAEPLASSSDVQIKTEAIQLVIYNQLVMTRLQSLLRLKTVVMNGLRLVTLSQVYTHRRTVKFLGRNTLAAQFVVNI